MAEATSPASVVEELKSVVAASIAGNVELVARLNTVIREAAAAGPAAGLSDGGAVLSRLIGLGLGTCAELNKHTLALLNGLVGVAERSLLPSASSSSAAAAAASPTMSAAGPAEGRIDVRLDGRIGERVACPFLVENQYDQAVDVSFRSDSLSAAGHRDLPSSLISFEPPRLSILARGSAVATAMVDVTDDFVAGATYTSTVRLVGFEGRQLGLALTVAPAAVAPAALPSAGRTADRPATAPARKAAGAAGATPVRRSRPSKLRRAGGTAG